MFMEEELEVITTVAAKPAEEYRIGGGIYGVTLISPGANKLAVIKLVREITGYGLKEAKELVDGAPRVVKRDVSGMQAHRIKAQLEEVGATAEVTC